RSSGRRSAKGRCSATATTSSRRPKRGCCPSTRPRYRAMCWGWLQPGKRRKHAARRESPCPLVIGPSVSTMAWRFLPLLGANDLEFNHKPREQRVKKITGGPRGLGQLISLGVLFALVPDAPAQQPAELIIRNGLIVTAVGRTEGDLRIRNGTIAEIG